VDLEVAGPVWAAAGPVEAAAVAVVAEVVAVEDDKEDTMKLFGTHTIRWLKPGTALVVLALLLLMGWSRVSAAPVGEPMQFGTPEAAAEALVTAFQNNDDSALASIFGSKYKDRLLSKDKAAAQESRTHLYQAAQEALVLRKDTEGRVVLVIGAEAWPFPIPIIRSGSGWRFNTAEGLEEIVNRRIGVNELRAISVCRDYLIAQRQYAVKIRDRSGVRKFAQRIISSRGKQDGLYWDPAIAGGEESPVGPLMAEFQAGGRKPREPYYGYYFRVLTRQGRRAPGGRYNYVINGNMIAGFALVAFPAEYGRSGIMTFLISHHGKVIQKDLGPRTRKIAAQMKDYNPDSTWTEVME
jgi:hypothetical protein